MTTSTTLLAGTPWRATRTAPLSSFPPVRTPRPAGALARVVAAAVHLGLALAGGPPAHAAAVPSPGGVADAPGASRIVGSLPRRADLGFTAREEDGGRLVVAGLVAGSEAQRAGLAEGDRLLAIQGRPAAPAHVARDLLRRLDGGGVVSLAIERAERRLEIRFTPAARPLERIAGLDIVYGDVTTPDGARLRTIVSRPAGSTGRLPAIFLAQWVSCGAIEPFPEDALGDIERALARRSGAVFLRVERSSGGDSEGPGCHELDYETELAHYRFALDRLLADPAVGADPERLVILGLSLGSTTAPFLAADRRIAGVVVSGAGALTFFERMMAFDRVGLERDGTPPAAIDGMMRRHAEFLVEYLLRGRDPEAIAAERPHLATVWSEMRGTGPGVHYGRPYAWHRQLAARDVLGAWSRIEAPVLQVYGEFDQFEPPYAHRVAVEMLRRQRARPESARAIEIQGMNHFFDVYPNAVDAMAERGGHPAPNLAAEPILRWLRDEVGFPAQP